jgi:hypothetical protein
MYRLTDWQLQAQPRSAAFLVMRVIHLRIHYLTDTIPEPQWSTDKTHAICDPVRDDVYALSRRVGGLMVMEVVP